MTRQTGKRHRESPSSPGGVQNLDTTTSATKPASARNLSGQMDFHDKPQRKKPQRTSAAAAAVAIALQKQLEQEPQQDHE